MEVKSPTMPCVVFLKYLKITGTGEDSQSKFKYSECKEVKRQLVLIVEEKKSIRMAIIIAR